MATYQQHDVYYVVNDKGLRRIAELLDKHHKHFSYGSGAMIAAYARDVEARVNDGNGSYFEISARYSSNGQPVICMLSRDHLSPVQTQHNIRSDADEIL